MLIVMFLFLVKVFLCLNIKDMFAFNIPISNVFFWQLILLHQNVRGAGASMDAKLYVEWSVLWNIMATAFLALISFFPCSSFGLSYLLLPLKFSLQLYKIKYSASNFYFFLLLESCGWGCFSSSEGSLSPSFRCNTEFKYTQSNPFYLLKLYWNSLW